MHIAFDCCLDCINEIISLERCLRLGRGYIMLIVVVIEFFFLYALSDNWPRVAYIYLFASLNFLVAKTVTLSKFPRVQLLLLSQ